MTAFQMGPSVPSIRTSAFLGAFKGKKRGPASRPAVRFDSAKGSDARPAMCRACRKRPTRSLIASSHRARRVPAGVSSGSRRRRNSCRFFSPLRRPPGSQFRRRRLLLLAGKLIQFLSLLSGVFSCFRAVWNFINNAPPADRCSPAREAGKSSECQS